MLHSTHTHTWPLGVCKWVDHHPRRPSTTALPPSSWAPRQRSLDPPRAQYGGASHTPPSLAEEPTPYVDWTRYHLQLLFVDRYVYYGITPCMSATLKQRTSSSAQHCCTKPTLTKTPTVLIRGVRGWQWDCLSGSPSGMAMAECCWRFPVAST